MVGSGDAGDCRGLCALDGGAAGGGDTGSGGGAFRGESLTYAELDARANRLAHHLIDGRRVVLGIWWRAPGALVGDGGRGVGGVEGRCAAYVPIDPGFPAARLAFMLEDTAAPAVVRRRLARRAARVWSGRSVRGWCWWIVDAALIAAAASAAPVGRGGERGVAYVIYTSGSTGRAEGRGGRACAAWSTSWRRCGGAGVVGGGRVAGGDDVVVRHLGAGAVLAVGERGRRW